MLLMWGVRFFAFQLLESPRYLIARGKDAEAVEVLQKVARFNGVECTLTIDQLRLVSVSAVADKGEAAEARSHGLIHVAHSSIRETWIHMKALFSSVQMAWSTILLVSLWGKSAGLD